MPKTLITNGKKYEGKYVALEDFGESRVLGSGDTPEEAYQEAITQAIKSPVILFVPSKDQVNIY